MSVWYAAIIILAWLATPILSQEHAIDENAFNAAMRRTQRPVGEWHGKARRISKIMEEEFSNLSGMDHRYKDVSEYDAAGSSRVVWEAITGGRGRKGEVIRIGNRAFSRNGLDEWTKKEISDSVGRQPANPFEGNNIDDPKAYSSWREPGSSVEYKVRAAHLKGEDVSVYRRVISSIQIHPKDGSEIKKETINHYWIGEDGRLVKFEQWINHSGKQFHGTQKVVMEWELDPKIVITAPVILP